jgi:hypothetical protein
MTANNNNNNNKRLFVYITQKSNALSSNKDSAIIRGKNK